VLIEGDELKKTANAYLRGKQLPFAEVHALWKALKSRDDLGLARSVLARMRQGDRLVDGLPADDDLRRKLCQQEALLTSRDNELPAASRHDTALRILRTGLGNIDDPKFDTDRETLGIAGGILKRRANELGNPDDLRKATHFYERAAGPDLGKDAYPHINAAFLNDLLAEAGDRPDERRARATALRQRIVDELTPIQTGDPDDIWFNAASRAEAQFGLKEYAKATAIIKASKARYEPWQLQTTARQIATLAHLLEPDPWVVPEIREFFEALLPGAPAAPRSVMIGKVGLALSGGGFRASLYHLGVLARLAELNVLRHIDVLSCVSGGSIVGACYWLALRRRLQQASPLTHSDYVALVQDLIRRFTVGIEGNLRGAVQPSMFSVIRNLLFRSAKGALDPEQTARAIDELFIQPLLTDRPSRRMDDLEFTPADHDPQLTHAETFHPGRHNWLRVNKVPVLVLNATTVNTGHGWQFTPTWMGESPWTVQEAADSIPRLEWSWYSPQAGWQIDVARAVAASACVPGVFTPLEINGAYEDLDVKLVDGGVYDNQGSVALLALDCNVVMVSDACGQLLAEDRPGAGLMGLLGYANRSMGMLMERVRLATFADLTARARSGLLRGLMFQHMKAGLDADTKRLKFSQESYELKRDPLTPAGIRKDFQQALSDLRTDLDVFSPDESNALMACGYQMTCWAFERDLKRLRGLSDPPYGTKWVFAPMLAEITSTDPATPNRDALLRRFRAGSATKI
jgi:predicted acylesterase/phospholipase RssA